MAKNTKLYKGDNLRLEVGAGVESGDPVVVGEIVGVALTDANDDNIATIRTKGSATLSVEDTATGGISVGDIIYIDNADNTLDNTDTNIRFGYALEEVADGQTAEIEVLIGY